MKVLNIGLLDIQFKMGNCNSEGIQTPISSAPPPPNPLEGPSPNTKVPEEQKIIKNNQESEVQNIRDPIQIGNSRSQELVNIVSSSFDLQQMKIAPRTQILAQQILNNFIVGKEIFGMLKNVAYTQTQANDLSKTLIQGIIALQKQQKQDEKQAVIKLFDKQNTKMIREEKLFYYGMLDKLKTKTVSQSSKSRIYHTIANIKKGTKIDNKRTNQYKIQCIKSNDYKELSEAELQEIVKYETIADNIRQMGEKINFKFQSIKKQSQKMVNLLGECMKNHINYINQLKYDLSQKQVMEVAKISRQACNYYENGVFILLVYFVQSSKRLQSQSVLAQNIQELLKRAIENISNMYPPGKGLSQQHSGLKKTLKDLEDPKKYKKIDFTHKKKQLKSTNKQMQVQNIIIQYAQIAESNKQLFEELVKATCLQRCVYFKIGLKYYPSNPNKKAITRIKEKMFFKKEQKSEKNMKGSIEEILIREQIAYRSIIDEILKDTDSVEFKISDMVRGKCVFLEVADIIESVNAIKKFVQKHPRYGIKEIQSRFTNPIPISDVTLKIVLNNQIVAELQLTIQTNAATYSFAHKIYELQRTKVFSKLKISHNYYEEWAEDFNELAKKAFQLQVLKTTISQQDNKGISQYFKLNKIPKPFKQILQEVIQENNSQINDLVISVDSTLQDLIIVAFSLALNRWGKPIGRIINKALTKQNTSPKLKSVLLSIFFEAFQLPVESQFMRQLGILIEQFKKKIFVEEYMREYFQIFKAFQYVNQNQRLFSRAQQLKYITFAELYESAPIALQNSAFCKNLVIEQHCLQQTIKLRELFNFYFVTKICQYETYDYFSNYYSWIKAQLTMNNNMDNALLKSQIQVIKAQELLQKNEPKQAQKILLEALDLFTRREEYSKVIECQILLTECSIKTTNKKVKDYIDHHDKKVVQKAQILGQQLKGALYADAIWRISQYLWEKVKNDNDKRLLLKTFTTIAFSQMSECKGQQFIYSLCQRWDQYDKYRQEKAKFKNNLKIKYISLRKIGAVACEHLSKANWKNLTNLNFHVSNIDAAGCEYLSKADWKSLTILNLPNSDVGDYGCEHLSKADWKSLTHLNLQSNKIGAVGCEFLSKADWRNLTILNLESNKIGAIGCEFLSKADWKSLTNINLYLNYIQAAGCEHLSKANWKSLQHLNVWYDDIGVKGCEHLSKADWRSLTNLQLFNNGIGDVGCEFLSKADWRSLTILNLQANKIGPAGCEFLIKPDWRSLTNLNLEKNNIGVVGCEYLIRADWKSLTILNLVLNNIGGAGCEHLSKGDWKSLSILTLTNNDIGDAGCEYLRKADWKNLNHLALNQNNIGENGCVHLSKGDWKDLISLELNKNNIKDQETTNKMFTQKQLKIYFG